MFIFLTLLVACCAGRGVFTDASPMPFIFDYKDTEIFSDTPPADTFSLPLRRRHAPRGISSFSDTVPEQPARGLVSAAVGETLEHARSIRFPGDVPGDAGSGFPEHSGDAAPDLVLPNLNRATKPTEATGDCVLDETLKISYNGITYTLFQNKPCAEEEWVVMVAECQPECRPRPCPTGQLLYREQCVDPVDPTVCGEGQILYLDQRGNTYCDCEKDHFYYPRSGQCVGRRERGRCDFGFFIDLNENGEVDCVPNPCQVDSFEMDPDSGRCFRKDFDGYCPPISLQFYHNNLTVGCELIDTRNLFDSPIAKSCPAGSRVGFLGNCRQEVVVPSITSRPRSITGRCRAGTIRSDDGTCRRLNTYIG
ncbi:hypothetical protein E2C01_026289 [Portunus trituberculatus]|uniref:DUF4789 domain-containing protein n=1 Tax=Portunus trituberculatus TaxID=210409 RepID=A0A5B7EIS0_PORTR|nr:hypothetical protein [Portunus trituberculatus]